MGRTEFRVTKVISFFVRKVSLYGAKGENWRCEAGRVEAGQKSTQEKGVSGSEEAARQRVKRESDKAREPTGTAKKREVERGGSGERQRGERERGSERG